MMLKSLVSPQTEHIEAVTAERDFFREKYASQMNEMEAMKLQLKESQRVIDRLRKRVLDLERCSPGEGEANGDGEKVESDGVDAPLDSVNHEEKSSLSNATVDPMEDATQNHLENTAVKQSTNEESQSQDVQPEEEDAPSDKDEEDEANRIRANAERLLQWSDYQTRRSPVNTPSGTKEEGKSFNDYDVTESAVQENDDSYSFHSPSKMEYSSIDSTSKTGGGGKMSKFLTNLKDIIDPPLDQYDVTDSDDERDESSDEESSIDHRSFDE